MSDYIELPRFQALRDRWSMSHGLINTIFVWRCGNE